MAIIQTYHRFLNKAVKVLIRKMLQIHMLVRASTILLMQAVCHNFIVQNPSSHRGYLASVFIGTEHRDNFDLR